MTAYFLRQSLPRTISMDIRKQVCSFMKTRSRTLRFEIMDVQMQENLNNCGLYVIACATELIPTKGPMQGLF